MGGTIAGPYGAGGGLIVGLITGLMTANSHYKELNDQVEAEEKKDKELEAQLMKEIERQRQLEAELEKTEAYVEPIDEDKQHESVQGISNEMEEFDPDQEYEEIGPLASLGSKKEASPENPNSSAKNTATRDVNRDGEPDLWIYYDPLKPGQVQRQEEDTNWDGSIDTWSYFIGGELDQRKVDSDKDGKADRWFFYENQSLAREEWDKKGDGQPNVRAFYSNGGLAKVEKDLNQDGKMDLWITYDPDRSNEVMIKEERDLNSNGAVDIWSFYEDGRLVRRDVSTVGLDYLVKQEKPLPEPRLESLPKN